jgi:hypothetical protein
VLVELRLNDLVEAAIDGREAFVHLFAEAADLDMHSAYLIAHVAANVVALFFDEACKLLELGLRQRDFRRRSLSEWASDMQK